MNTFLSVVFPAGTRIGIVAFCVSTLLVTGAARAQVDFWEPAGGEAFDARALFVDGTNNVYVATFTDGIYRSGDGGDSWSQINNGLTNLLGRALVVNSAGHVYAGTDFGGVFRSTDNGANWTEMNTGLANLGINVLATDNADVVFAGTQGGVFRSQDEGATWSLVYEGSGAAMQTIAIDTTSSVVFSAGHTNTFALFGRSDDGGDTWTFVPDFGPANSHVQTLALNDSGDLFAGLTFGGIFLSVDAAANWNPVNIGVPEFAEIKSIAIDHSGDVYAAVQQQGVLVSTDNGGTWAFVNSGLPIGPVLGKSQSLGINVNGDIFLGTSQGVFRHKSTSTSIGDSADERQALASLDQNYPNPFHQTTTIRYTLRHASEVRLSVTDVLGRQIVLLESGVRAAGEHELPFSAADIPSGLYFYRLDSNGAGETRAMVVSK
jgi:photosystem II stability/assembly factor-like uncharacterized protein